MFYSSRFPPKASPFSSPLHILDPSAGSSWLLGPECSSLVLLQEACCAYVLMVTAVYWVSEAVPLGAAALVPAFLYPLFGVLKSSEVSVEEVLSGSTQNLKNLTENR